MMSHNEHTPEQSKLNKRAPYASHYEPTLLFPMPRKPKREAIGILDTLPFFGFDRWNHYELSWLNEHGKPVVALGDITYGCESNSIFESKSMKLYFNSFNNTSFANAEAVEATIKHDLGTHLQGTPVTVQVTPLHLVTENTLQPRLPGICLDTLDVACSVYHTDPTFLTTETEYTEETLCSDLLKSNCLVTNQPDWCSVQISYKGPKINHAGLLRYLVSFRNDNEFHEQCIEKIFMHILQRCQPLALTVSGRSTRRGGLDINSYRSTDPVNPADVPNPRLCRQ